VHRAAELRKSEHHDSALFALARARQLDPEWAEPLRQTGAVFEERGQIARAVRDYSAALDLDATSGAATALSRLLRDCRDPMAETALRAAADGAADWLPTARAWAAHQLRTGDGNGATATLERCAAACPDDPECWIELARILGAEPERAESLLRRALDLDPGSERARRLLAEVLVRAGRYIEAVDLMDNSRAKGLEGSGEGRVH